MKYRLPLLHKLLVPSNGSGIADFIVSEFAFTSRKSIVNLWVCSLVPSGNSLVWRTTWRLLKRVAFEGTTYSTFSNGSRNSRIILTFDWVCRRWFSPFHPGATGLSNVGSQLRNLPLIKASLNTPCLTPYSMIVWHFVAHLLWQLRWDSRVDELLGLVWNGGRRFVDW